MKSRQKKVVIGLGILVIIFTIYWISVKLAPYNKNYSGELIGIQGTFVYHRDDCKFLNKVDNDKLLFFSDLKAAADAEYRACKTCKPTSNETILTENKKIREQIKEKNIAEYRTRLEQYQIDIQNSKVIGITVSDQDEQLILQGKNPAGVYKNKKDEPSWYKSDRWTDVVRERLKSDNN